MRISKHRYFSGLNALLAVSLCLIPAQASSTSDIDAMMEQASNDKNEGDYNNAESHLKQALSMSVQNTGAMSTLTGKISRQIAEFYTNRGRYTEAERYYQRAMVIAAGYNGASSDSQGEFLNTRQFVNAALQNPSTLPGSVDMANTLSGLANVYTRQEKYGDAERMLNRVIEIYKSPGSSPLNYVQNSADVLAINMRSLAQVLYKEGKVNEAEETFKSYVEGVRKDKGPSPQLAEALTHLCAFYSSQNRSSEADAAAAEAKDLQSLYGTR